MKNRTNTIEVTVDKSHIVTIGERLYGESIELIRELINNAYDADATEAKVTLKGISKKFDIPDVERRIIETVPIKAPNFNVFLNGHKVSARFIPGHKIPFLEGTEYGIVYGEIIITSQLDQDITAAGIECKVKQVTIARDFFGLQDLVKNIARIKGEVNADFLPITSDRTGFIKDSPQYKKFLEVMERVVKRVKPVLDELSDYKENRRVRRTLSEVLEKVKNALLINPDFCPNGLIPIGENIAEGGQPGFVSSTKEMGANKKKVEKLEVERKKKRKKKPVVKRLTPPP